MKKEITIGIAEDHPLLRVGLVSSLKQHKNINILFDVGNGKELLNKLKTLRPEIILLDIEMPVMRAQDVMQRISVKYPKIKIIIISAFFQKDYIIECFKLCAKAFLPKGDEVEKVVEVINIVHEKGIYTGTEVSKILTEELQNSNKKPSNLRLTSKELDVLNSICNGNTRKKTAEALEVTLDTINFHMSNIMRKTNTDNVQSLIKYAIENKLHNSN
ncbi:MAG: response regulator transcription factor [Bacteroidota bacterium]|nr:response regulator transcription factor [Bacteroidota bacterium]